MRLRKLRNFVQLDTAGWIAVASLVLCGLSGALLAIPFDFSRAFQSIFKLMLFNPVGSFVRNFHYWSSQLFFLFAILHICDHFSKSTESNIRNYRTWLILCLAVLCLGYEMLSGFILKGDAAGLQAARILSSMLESVPVIGKMLRSALTGSEDHSQVVYVQHIATGMIFLVIAVYEHVKAIRLRTRTFVAVFAGLFLISLIFRAPMGLSDGNELKGPWFFLGIQEMLHWTSYPLLVMLIFLLFFLLLIILPRFGKKGRSRIKWTFLWGGLLYLFMSLLVFLFRGENWEWQNGLGNGLSGYPSVVFDPINLFDRKLPVSIPENAKTEGCLVCHGEMKGLSDSHNPASTGCYTCHLGDPFSSDKQTAHRHMILVPGNFSNVRQTCGTQNCHSEIADRIMNSQMTTLSGIVGIDRFVFGETTSLNDTCRAVNIGHSAADSHLRNLCAGCHLGNEKISTGQAQWLERGGGCNACHLLYNGNALATLNRIRSKTMEQAGETHPAIDIGVTNDKCKSCHSRSGRISLGYEGWNETSLMQGQVTDTTKFKILPDDRVVEFIGADIHHQKGMACIDCHGSYEVMGDGKHHIHQEDAVGVQCIDCHPSGEPKSIAIRNLPDRESLMIAGLRRINPENKVILTANGGRPLLNTIVDSLNRIFLMDKLTGKLHESKRMSPVCSRGKGHSRLACETCHSAWVPQCIGCHNSYEKNSPGTDMLTGKPTKGSWVEYAGKSFAEPPVIGISENAGGKVVTAMPGMILSIDRESFEKCQGKRFYRLYAPASGHTTQRVGRSCKSCHNNPLAIGYGRGELKYESSGTTGTWTFLPRFRLNEIDQLPEDAWTGFLKEAKAPYATRDGLRPFNVKEQAKILLVGSCLTCHDEKSKVMVGALGDFEQTMAKRNKKCVLPTWR